MTVKPEQIKLSRLGMGELELVLAWRNDPEVMRYLPSAQRPLTWEDHLAWYERYEPYHGVAIRQDWMIELTESGHDRGVGVVHYITYTSEIGLIVGEKTLWGQGVGRIALNIR